MHILKDSDHTNPQRITAGACETVTMAQILKSAGGERIPSVSESQKDFNLACIVTQDLPYNDAAYAYFSLLARELMSKNRPERTICWRRFTGRPAAAPR